MTCALKCICKALYTSYFDMLFVHYHRSLEQYNTYYWNIKAIAQTELRFINQISIFDNSKTYRCVHTDN